MQLVLEFVFPFTRCIFFRISMCQQWYDRL